MQAKADPGGRVTGRDGQRAIAHGVKIALGINAAVYPHGNNALEFVLMANDGMTPAQSLKADMSVAADLLGLSDKVATLEAGKFADIVAVPGNPLENINVAQSVSFVMKDGIVYKDDRGLVPRK